MSKINNIEENLKAISTLVQALAYVQEVTIMTKADINDITSPMVPHYSYKKTMIEGELRSKIESKLSSLIDLV